MSRRQQATRHRPPKPVQLSLPLQAGASDPTTMPAGVAAAIANLHAANANAVAVSLMLGAPLTPVHPRQADLPARPAPPLPSGTSGQDA